MTVRRRLFVLITGLLATVTMVVPASAVPIPPGIGEAFVPHYIGHAATPDPVQAPPVPQHPFMAPNGASSMHNNAYNTDAYRRSGPLGKNLQVSSQTYGIRECATIAFDSQGRIEALCGSLTGSKLMLIDPESLNVLATHTLPPRKLELGSNPLEDICGGAYFYLDNRDRAVIPTTNRQIWVIGQQETRFGTTFALQRTYDLSDSVPKDDCLIALMPDWNGLIWYATQGGRVGTVDPETGETHSIKLAGAGIFNSFAVDETGGVFIVSDHALYRFDSAPDGAPRITWREPYDRGSRKKPGQLSQGSGTSPTLIGDDLIAITDNAEPRMHVRVYHRSAGSDGSRLVCSQAVFDAGSSATENSMVAVGSSVIVENNYGYTGPTSTMFGNSTAPGIARVDISESGCSVAWTSQERAPTSVPKASLVSGLLYVYTKPESPVTNPWYFTAIDLQTGETVYQQLTGTGLQWNNHYAAIYLGPDGAAFVPTLAGIIRIEDAPGNE